ncbi:MAG: YceD family protein, partial [Acidobacteriota bacterium]
MYIDLDKLSDGFKKFDETIELDLNEESARLLEPVRIFGELKKGIVQVDLEGKIEAKVEIECSRCLSPVESTLEFAFKVGYITEEHYTKEKESELHGDDL